eukprot:4888970-Ditylum_brightwellii.AAC.1
MYGLPQAGKIANDLLKQCLALHGYYEVSLTPGIWYHMHRPVTFTLVVNDFGIKFVGNRHINHLLDILKNYYTLEVDYEGSLYCGISLKWNYALRYLDINMHEYIAEQLIKYGHQKPKCPQHSLHKAPCPAFGKDAQK